MHTNRLDYIDYLRAWAMVVMIEVHVVNCFLQPSLKSEWWYHIINFINGLVAPIFIFLSGYSFILANFNKRAELIQLSSFFFKRLGRIVLIILTGYSLHIPYFSLKNISIYASDAELKAFYNVDVLQCIGVGLLVLLILRMAIKNDIFYLKTITILGLLIVFLTPYVWKTDFSRWLPLPLASYYNEMHGSLFPIFPWHGFLLLGASLAIINANNTHTITIMNHMQVIAAVAFSIAGIIFMHYRSKDPSYNVKVCPIFFFTRLAIVTVLLKSSAVYLASKNSLPEIFCDFGKESLLVYWLHLQILYRHFFNGRSWEMIVHQQYAIIECIYAFIFLTAFTFSIALLWNKLKGHLPQLSQKLFYLMVVCVVAKFLFF
ncbi:MAG: DUF1624 domain-containing protein [Spirochaetes bacterium]|nr:DUF1624 domain-containing protein [Spirochaetota bacterium]